MYTLKKQVVNGKVQSIYLGNGINASKYYQLRCELSKKG
jgi:hypothetical protein